MYFEDFFIGQDFTSSNYLVTLEEITEFALKYDPQYMHVNAEKAKKSIFKGIIASGLHTMAIATKLWVEMGILGDQAICGVGIDQVKFVRAVYPGDCLTLRGKVRELTSSTSENRGYITTFIEVLNQEGYLVVSFLITGLIARKVTGNREMIGYDV